MEQQTIDTLLQLLPAGLMTTIIGIVVALLRNWFKEYLASGIKAQKTENEALKAQIEALKEHCTECSQNINADSKEIKADIKRLETKIQRRNNTSE